MTAGNGDAPEWLDGDAALRPAPTEPKGIALSMTSFRSITLLTGLAFLVLATLAIAGCGSSGTKATGPPKTASGKTATVGVSNASLGNIVVNSRGRTVYFFNRDSGTKSECNGACAANWPPLLVAGKPTIGGGAKVSLVSTSTRSNGARQVTYNSHPLYLFKGDSKPGDTNGEGLTAFGGSWFAVSPAGAQIPVPAASSGGGGGY